MARQTSRFPAPFPSPFPTPFPAPLLKIAAVVAVVGVLPLLGSLSRSEELRTTDASFAEKQTYTTTYASKTFESKQREDLNGGQIVIDPLTGEIIKGDGKVSSGHPAPAPEPEPEPKAFDYFDNYEEGSFLLDSYFLAQLSMNVYSSQLNEAYFLAELQEKFAPQGIHPDNIEVKMDDEVGTELAMFTIGDAVVFAFRGTSAQGTKVPDADLKYDMDDYPLVVKLNEKNCRVHRGFWDSTDAVYDWVLARAILAHAEGKRIFLTGHSLGGARATVAAARLLYNDHIPITNLATFGSPKVGTDTFVGICVDTNDDEISLWSRTDRWVVVGDAATTFFEGEWVGTKFYEYAHMGHTHNIFAVDNQSEDFEVAPNSGAIPFTPSTGQYYGFLNGLGDTEHMWYDDGLLDEIIDDPAHQDLEALIEQYSNVVQTDGGI